MNIHDLVVGKPIKTTDERPSRSVRCKASQFSAWMVSAPQRMARKRPSLS